MMRSTSLAAFAAFGDFDPTDEVGITEQQILVDCEGAKTTNRDEGHEPRACKRIKSEPTIVTLDEETIASSSLAEMAMSMEKDGGFFIGGEEEEERTEDTAEDPSDMMDYKTPKPLEPKFGAPPLPVTCDPNMDPDAFIGALVKAYLGYSPQIRPSLGLPESYFPPLDNKHLASYGIEVVAAVRENDLAAVRALHRSGHPLACCNRFGESLLHMACRRGYVSVFAYLTGEAGVGIRIRDDCGRTPLHDACWNHEPQYEIVDALLRMDPALLLVSDKRGHTPFAYARREHWGLWRQFLSDRADHIVRGMDRREEREIFSGVAP